MQKIISKCKKIEIKKKYWIYQIKLYPLNLNKHTFNKEDNLKENFY